MKTFLILLACMLLFAGFGLLSLRARRGGCGSACDAERRAGGCGACDLDPEKTDAQRL